MGKVKGGEGGKNFPLEVRYCALCGKKLRNIKEDWKVRRFHKTCNQIYRDYFLLEGDFEINGYDQITREPRKLKIRGMPR